MCSTTVALPSVYRSKRVMRVYHCLILQACNSPKWLCKHSENFKYHICVSRFFTHGAIFSDDDIANMVKGCAECQAVRHLPAKAPLHPWAWPTAPWERIHVHFIGPFLGKMFFVVTDAHSKWPEVSIMSSTTAGQTINVLRELFARFGIP